MNRRLQARIKKAHLEEHYTNVTYYAWGGKCWQRLSCPVYVGKEEIEEVRRSPTFARLLATGSYPAQAEGVVGVGAAQHGRRTLALIAADEEQLAEAAAAVEEEEDPSRL